LREQLGSLFVPYQPGLYHFEAANLGGVTEAVEVFSISMRHWMAIGR
jgi:hypothetical protein